MAGRRRKTLSFRPNGSIRAAFRSPAPEPLENRDSRIAVRGVGRGFHHGDGGIARLVNFCGVAVALEMLLTAEPIDAERAQQINLISKVVPHDQLMASAEQTARCILRNDQTAIRSAKRTIMDMIGRPLDDQLKAEALASYTLVSGGQNVLDRLQSFYDKTDRGRHGEHATSL